MRSFRNQALFCGDAFRLFSFSGGNENARLIRNAERREAYHTLYLLEAPDYEGNSIAYLDAPEYIVIRAYPKHTHTTDRDAATPLMDVEREHDAV